MPCNTEKAEILAFLRENISPHIPMGEIRVQPCVQQLGMILGDASSCLLPYVALDVVIHNNSLSMPPNIGMRGSTGASKS